MKKSSLLPFFIAVLALLALLPYAIGLAPALFTKDTPLYIMSFLNESDFCSAPAVESLLFRCVLHKFYLLDSSYFTYSIVKVAMAALICGYFSFVLAKIDRRLVPLSLLPVIHPYFGMYVMLDERDVVFDLILSLIFILLLHLRLLKNRQHRQGVLALVILLAVLTAIKSEGLIFAVPIFLYFFFQHYSQVKMRMFAVTLLVFGIGAGGKALLNSTRLQSVLVAPVLMMINTQPYLKSYFELALLEKIFGKNNIENPDLNFNRFGSLAKTQKIKYKNYQLFPDRTLAPQFNRAALKIILERPLLFLKIRTRIFKALIYERIFALRVYGMALETHVTEVHSAEIYEKHIKSNRPDGVLFSYLVALDDRITAGIEKSLFVTVLFTPIFGLLLALLVMVGLKRNPVAAIACSGLVVQMITVYFLAPEASAKYVYASLATALFVAVIALAEHVKHYKRAI